jgi:hypothetical protein
MTIDEKEQAWEAYKKDRAWRFNGCDISEVRHCFFAGWNQSQSQPPQAEATAQVQPTTELNLSAQAEAVKAIREARDRCRTNALDLLEPIAFREYCKDMMLAFDEALRLLPALEAAAGGWKDISTVPKDGTKVLTWDGKNRCIESYNNFGWSLRKLISRFGDDSEPDRPTHWMPLPPPPAAGGKGGA